MRKLIDAILYHGVPQEWRRLLAAMEATKNPALQESVNAGHRFLTRWGREVHRCGFTTEDIFGAAPTQPYSAGWSPGLLWLMGPGEVVAISADGTIQVRYPDARICNVFSQLAQPLNEDGDDGA